jgi:FMN phosphatase YigB (HAD superfamily)
MKTIVFDFGNVVGFFDVVSSLKRMAPHSTLSVEEMRAAISASNIVDDYESGRMSTAEFLACARDLLQLSCDEQLMIDAYSDIFRPNTEVCQLIPTLKPRYQLLLGSNTNELHAAQFRCQFAETLQYFDGMILSHEVGARKPRAEFYKHCQRLADGTPGQCLFIDDLPANIAGARACGWNGIVYRDFTDLCEQLRSFGVAIDP